MTGIPLSDLIRDMAYKETPFTNVAAGQQIAKPDPTRFSIIFVANSGSVAISSNPNAPTGTGIVLSNTAAVFQLVFPWHGVLTTLGWQVVAGGIGTNMTVIEMFYRPSGG